MRMSPGFDKATEIYFRLGIIYKQQKKYQQSLEVRDHPSTLQQCQPLTRRSASDTLLPCPPPR